MEQYNPQVSPEATQATAPEELHPVAAAFGGDIGAALQASGKEVADRIQTLSFHMARMNYYRGEAQKQDLINNYQSELLDKTMGTGPNDPRTVTSVGGNVMPDSSQLSLSQAPPQSSTANISGTGAPAVEIPAAIYNRQGYEANGALQDFKDWHQATVAKYLQQAQGLGVRVDSQFKMSMDKLGAAEEFHIAKHETQQVNQAQIKTYMTGLQLSAQSAVTKQDPASLGLTVDAINQQVDGLIKTQHLDNDPSGPIMAELQKNKFVGQALNNSITATLKTNSGDPTQAQAMLDRLHTDGRITDTQNTNASDYLEKASKSIISQNETAAKMQTVNVRMDAFNKIGQGKFDISNQSLIDDYASKDPELGNALQTVAESRGQYKPERNDAQDREYQKSVTAMINSSSQDQLSGYMTKILSDKNGITQTHMNIMVNALLNHAKTLPVIDGQPNSPVAQNTASSAFNALSTWADKADLSTEEKTNLMNSYLEGMSKNGSAPKDNYESAIRNHMISAYPNLATKDPENIPTEIDGKSQGFNKAVNFAEGTEQAKAIKYPDRRLEATKSKESEVPEETPGQAIDKLLGKKDNG